MLMADMERFLVSLQVLWPPADVQLQGLADSLLNNARELFQ
jgi:hypothetical protein